MNMQLHLVNLSLLHCSRMVYSSLHYGQAVPLESLVFYDPYCLGHSERKINMSHFSGSPEH